MQGNPDLEPEKSRSINAGFVLEPFKDLSLTMDYYRIERRNEIGVVGNYKNYRYNVRAATTWARGDWKVGGVVTYVPETRLIDWKYSTNWTPEGCEAQGIPSEYCRLKEDVLVNLNLSYSGIKNTVVSAYLNNVFNREERVNMRAVDPEPRGRTLRVALQYTF